MRSRKMTQFLLQQQVDWFNNTYPVGSTVNLKMDSGEVKEVTVYDKATVLGGHSAVGWFNEISGCYSLDRVKKQKSTMPF